MYKNKVSQRMIEITMFFLLFVACNAIVTTSTPLITTTTSTETPQITSTPVPTFMPTATQTSEITPTLILTNTSTGSCVVPDGEWKGIETQEVQELGFQVSDCKISNLLFWAYPVPDEIFFYTGEMSKSEDITIMGNAFISTESNPYGAGELIIQGELDTKTSMIHGTLQFSKGFLVVDYKLSDVVILEWTASVQK